MSSLDLQSEREADYRIVELAGKPTSIGRRHASYLIPAASPFRRWPWETNRDFLMACGTIVRDAAPWLWPELATFAEMVGLPVEQGLFVRAGSLPHGCSAEACIRRWQPTGGARGIHP